MLKLTNYSFGKGYGEYYTYNPNNEGHFGLFNNDALEDIVYVGFKDLSSMY